MRLFFSALIATTLAGCVPPIMENKPMGFDAYLAGDRGGYSPMSQQISPESSAVRITEEDLANPETRKTLKRASERSFGIGSSRKGSPVTVKGKEYRLRVVESRGYHFAVFERPPFVWDRTVKVRQDQDLLDLEDAANRHTSCTTSGYYAYKRYYNGTPTKFSFHVNC